MKSTRSIFAVVATALLLVAGACSSNDKATTKGTNTDTASAKTASSDTSSTDTGASDTGLSDTSSADTGSTDSGFSTSSSSGSSSTSSTSSTGSTGAPGSGYSATFKSAFVKGCAGSDPAKQGPCQCVIDKVSASIPYDEFLKNATNLDALMHDPRILKILSGCKLGSV